MPVSPLRGEGVGLRFQAWLFDLFVVALLAAVPIGLLVLLFPARDRTGPVAVLGLPLVGVGIFAIIWFLHFTILEGAWGTTLGKTIGLWPLGPLRVVRVDGSPCGYGQAALRALLGLFESGLLGAIVIWATAKHRRLGDLAAGTLVVARHKVPRSPSCPSARCSSSPMVAVQRSASSTMRTCRSGCT